MKAKKQIKKLSLFAAILGLSALFFSGCAAYYNPSAYSQGYFNVGVSTPNFVFSLGNGVSAYDAPMYGTYIYGYNGYYWRWLDGGWVYASTYAGPWYPVTAGIYLPPILAFGPPPPVWGYSPYFTWWNNNIGPWYRVNHPGWWGRHHMYLRNYGTWQSHSNRFYGNRPYQNWRMRKPFGHGGNSYRGPVNNNQGGNGFRAPVNHNQGGNSYRGPVNNNQGGNGFRAPVNHNQGGNGFRSPVNHNQGGNGFRGPVNNNQGGNGFRGPVNNNQGGNGFRAPVNRNKVNNTHKRKKN